MITHGRPQPRYKPCWTNPLGELMGDPNPEKHQRVTDAMLEMQKIIVADRQKAYDGQFRQFLP
jgi:hypothetical protein